VVNLLLFNNLKNVCVPACMCLKSDG